MISTYHQLGFGGICQLLRVIYRSLLFCVFPLPVFDITSRLHALLDDLLDQVLEGGKCPLVEQGRGSIHRVLSSPSFEVI